MSKVRTDLVTHLHDLVDREHDIQFDRFKDVPVTCFHRIAADEGGQAPDRASLPRRITFFLWTCERPPFVRMKMSDYRAAKRESV